MLQELKEIFKTFAEKQIYRILLSIKSRNNKYNDVWISRKEWKKYWLSEKQMRNFINFLRDTWNLTIIWKRKSRSWWLCNIYKLSEWFIEWLKIIRGFTFKYIEPISFVKRHFIYKKKYWRIKFKVNWNRYFIQLIWDFPWVIYWVEENKIINPYLLMKWYETY